MQDEPLNRQQQVQQALERAIAQNQLYLCYQAQHRLTDHQLVGLEALCRLEVGALGPLSAEEFIPVAEATGLIAPLEKLVLDQVRNDLPLLLTHYGNRPPHSTPPSKGRGWQGQATECCNHACQGRAEV